MSPVRKEGTPLFDHQKKIEEIPNFDHDIDASTFSKLPSDADRQQAAINSQLRQQFTWLAEVSVSSHNKLVEISAYFRWIMRGLVAVLITEFVPKVGPLLAWIYNHTAIK